VERDRGPWVNLLTAIDVVV